MRLCPNVEGYLVKRSWTVEQARTSDCLIRPCMDPLSSRQVDGPLVDTRFDHRCNQEIVPEQILKGMAPDLGIVGPLEQKRSHQRQPTLDGQDRLGHQVWQEPFPELRKATIGGQNSRVAGPLGDVPRRPVPRWKPMVIE